MTDLERYVRRAWREVIQSPTDTEVRRKFEYAKAYVAEDRETALVKLRSKWIAEEIGKTYDRDAQLAILFNKDIHPEEYEAYQSHRALCKSFVDSVLQKLREEIELVGGA